ncbi:MAG: malate synthase G, partial [Pseudomonadales bacterium]
MAEYVAIGELKVSKDLHDLVRDEIAPGTEVEPEAFWNSFGAIVRDLGPKNRALLDKRDALQAAIDAWLVERKGQAIDPGEMRGFLLEIGYLVPEGQDFSVTTANVDLEIANLAGPQLVVPVDNARYALNAANARWGSLYDAFYGTDIIPETPGAEKGTSYNPGRGEKVVGRTAEFLDEVVALARGSHSDVTEYRVNDGVLVTLFQDGSESELAAPEQFAGYIERDGEVRSVLLRQNGLHIEIQIDRAHPVGETHSAGVKDVLLEAALTTIEDCEDAVSAVDAQDKIQVYRNWTGLMNGTLTSTFDKGGESMTRTLSADRTYTGPDGTELTLPGRALMLVRNVGQHMYTDAVTTSDGEPVPEGFLDAMVTCLAAKHDLLGASSYRNSGAGSIYVVKP